MKISTNSLLCDEMLEASKIEAAVLTAERADSSGRGKKRFFYKFKEFLPIMSL